LIFLSDDALKECSTRAFSRLPFFSFAHHVFLLAALFFVFKRQNLMDKRTQKWRGLDEITNLFRRVEDFHSDVCQIGKKDRELLGSREVFKRNNRMPAARDEDGKTRQSAFVLDVDCGGRRAYFNRIGFHIFCF
jgi:hypothetical protein